MAADGFPEPPLDAIPNHGLADRAWDGETDARPLGLGLADAERREQRAGEAGAFVINPSEIFRAQQADTFRKTGDGTATFRS